MCKEDGLRRRGQAGSRAGVLLGLARGAVVVGAAVSGTSCLGVGVTVRAVERRRF